MTDKVDDGVSLPKRSPFTITLKILGLFALSAYFEMNSETKTYRVAVSMRPPTRWIVDLVKTAAINWMQNAQDQSSSTYREGSNV